MKLSVKLITALAAFVLLVVGLVGLTSSGSEASAANTTAKVYVNTALWEHASTKNLETLSQTILLFTPSNSLDILADDAPQRGRTGGRLHNQRTF